MKQLILVRGIPGSGKSTLARQLMNLSDNIMARHYEADMFFMDEAGSYNFDASKLNRAHNWCIDKTRDGLEQNRTVVVSNTFTTWKEMAPYVKMAQNGGYKVQILECHGNFGSIHNVPLTSIQKMRDRW
jgi:predicted kinase